jgi:hypothetical protein
VTGVEYFAALSIAALALWFAWRQDRKAWKLERDGSINERMKRVVSK